MEKIKNECAELELLEDVIFCGYDMINKINHIDRFNREELPIVNARTAAGWFYNEITKNETFDESNYIDRYVESAKGFENEEKYLEAYPFPDFYTVLGKVLYKECEKSLTCCGKSVVKDSPLITEKTTEAFMKARTVTLFDMQVSQEIVKEFLSVKQFFDTEDEFLQFLEEHSFEARRQKRQDNKASE